jgi:hypothetical protein
MGPIMGIFVGAMHLSPGFLALIIPAWLGTTYFTARSVYGYWSRKRANQLESVADRLAALARELIPAKPALPAGRSVVT